MVIQLVEIIPMFYPLVCKGKFMVSDMGQLSISKDSIRVLGDEHHPLQAHWVFAQALWPLLIVMQS